MPTIDEKKSIKENQDDDVFSEALEAVLGEGLKSGSQRNGDHPADEQTQQALADKLGLPCSIT